MTNSIITAEQYASVAADLVGKDLNLGGLISRNLEADFGSGSGATVRVRIPGAVLAHAKPIYDRSTPLVTSDVIEQGVSVTLSEHAYSSAVLSEGDLDLSIVDFGSQILRPQATSIVRRVESQIAATFADVPETTSITHDPEIPARTFTAIRRILRGNGLDSDAPLVAAVGSNVYADLLDGPVGSSGVTFDENGRVRGFTVVESNRLDPDEIIGFTPSAFTLVVRAPAVPQGAPFGSSIKSEDFALRYIRTFDGSVAADRSIVSAFTAVQAMPLAVDREDGTVDLVENGGVVRVNTAA